MEFAESPGAGDERWAAPADPAPRLGELLDKYDQLIALRRGAEGRTVARRDAMRAVAARFPAALREWDSLPLGELQRRRGVVQEALAQAARGQAPAALGDAKEAWLRFSLDLHVHLRAMLRLRRWLRQRTGGAPDAISAIDAALLTACQRFFEEGEPAWPERLSAARLRHLASPPAGRLAEIVYADVAARHGVPVATVKRALFSGPDGR